MLFKSALVTQVSGSVGGMTGAHNSSGLYFRARTIPTNPNTPQQQTVRNAMSTLATRWNDTLTQTERDAWDNYADIVTVTNPLGDQIKISGLNHFVRSNVPRIQVGLPVVDSGPTTFNLGSFTEPVLIITAPTTGSLAFTESDAWVGEDDAAMLVFVGRGMNATVNFFKGPYRFAGTVLGDATTPLTTPQVITSPFTMVAGQRAFYRVTVSRADGRYSPTFRIFDPVV